MKRVKASKTASTLQMPEKYLPSQMTGLHTSPYFRKRLTYLITYGAPRVNVTGYFLCSSVYIYNYPGNIHISVECTCYISGADTGFGKGGGPGNC